MLFSSAKYMATLLRVQTQQFFLLSLQFANSLRNGLVDSFEYWMFLLADTQAGSREYVMDSEFRWAQDNYNSTQRSIEIWAFIVQLRVRLTLLDQKWTYAGGFTDEKCAAASAHILQGHITIKLKGQTSFKDMLLEH